MKKSLLLTLLMALVGIFAAHADNVMINVDNAANVIVTTGSGDPVDLIDGMNRVPLDASQNPLTIAPADGATIVSVTKNESDVLNPSGDGKYRVGIENMKLDIVTSGGQAVQKDIQIGFMAMGSGIAGNPYKILYQKDNEWVAASQGSFTYTIPSGALVKIVPDKFYGVTGVTSYINQVNGTLNADGSYTFTATDAMNNDYLYVSMAPDPKAKKFKLTIDYLDNAECLFEFQRDGTPYQKVAPQYNNVAAEIMFEDAMNPLEIKPVEGGKIVQVLRNGEVALATGWGGSNGYVFEVEDGDEFVVSTQGPEADIALTVPDGYVDLKYFYFTKSDGTVLNVSGTSATIKGNVGEIINVSPRPGSKLSFLGRTNGGVVTNNYNNGTGTITVTKGADGENPAQIQVCGSRTVTGVTINVDNASRVKVLQANGRGDELTLVNGDNNFILANLQNALAITTTDGNEITAVEVNGYPVTVSPDGYFKVEAAESDYITIKSRKNAIDATLKFTFSEGADASWLRATSNGLDVVVSTPMTVRSYTTLIFEAAPGYVLQGMEPVGVTPGLMVMEEVSGTARYSVRFGSADLAEATLNVTMKEMEPAEGNSIVIANGDPLFFKYWETTENRFSSETFVKTLSNNTVNEVKTGNWVRVYLTDTESVFTSIKVNGQPIELAQEEGKASRTQWVQINGRTVIDPAMATPTLAYTNPTFDDVKHAQAGNVYFEVDGQKVSQTYVQAGTVLKLIAEPADGYIFKNFELYTVEDTDITGGTAIDGDTYTVKESDLKDNYLLFKGVFTEDENNKSYVLRGSSAWIVDADGKFDPGTSQSKGNVVFFLEDGSNVREVIAFAGDVVKLGVGTEDPDFAANYEVAGFSLMAGFPDAVIPANYTVKAEDADTTGVIWICGMVREKGSGVDSIVAAEGYDAAAGTFCAKGAVKIFDANGRLVAAGHDTVSVAGLAKGIYIAVANGKTVKFAK